MLQLTCSTLESLKRYEIESYLNEAEYTRYEGKIIIKLKEVTGELKINKINFVL